MMTQLIHMLKTLRQQSTGSVLVEFALVVPAAFLLFAGLANFGYIANGYLKMNVAMNAGILYAFGNSPNTNNIKTAMTNAVNQPSLTTTITQFCECSNSAQPGCSSTCSDGKTPGTYITITAQLPVTLPFPNFILTSPYTISEKITFRIQ